MSILHTMFINVFTREHHASHLAVDYPNSNVYHQRITKRNLVSPDRHEAKCVCYTYGRIMRLRPAAAVYTHTHTGVQLLLQ